MKYILMTLFVILFSITTPSWATTGIDCDVTVDGIPTNSKHSASYDIDVDNHVARVDVLWIGDLGQCEYYDALEAVDMYLQKHPTADGAELTAFANAYKDSYFREPSEAEITVTRN